MVESTSAKSFIAAPFICAELRDDLLHDGRGALALGALARLVGAGAVPERAGRRPRGAPWPATRPPRRAVRLMRFVGVARRRHGLRVRARTAAAVTTPWLPGRVAAAPGPGRGSSRASPAYGVSRDHSRRAGVRRSAAVERLTRQRPGGWSKPDGDGVERAFVAPAVARRTAPPPPITRSPAAQGTLTAPTAPGGTGSPVAWRTWLALRRDGQDAFAGRFAVERAVLDLLGPDGPRADLGRAQRRSCGVFMGPTAPSRSCSAARRCRRRGARSPRSPSRPGRRRARRRQRPGGEGRGRRMCACRITRSGKRSKRLADRGCAPCRTPSTSRPRPWPCVSARS